MSDERNVGHWRNDTDPIKRAIAAVVAYSWAHTGAFEELQALSEELRALIGIKERLAAIEAERDALVQALIDAPGDAIMMAIDLGTREKFPRSGAFHLEDPMHVIWKAVYEATMAHDARTKESDCAER